MVQKQHANIVVFGHSLAASMTVLALSKSLSHKTALLWVKPLNPCPSDMLYGGITSPEAYQFNLQLGVTEPELVLNTDTTFSFGTRFIDWGQNNQQWIQSFHLPFAAIKGVDLHHFMTKHKMQLGEVLISSQAALRGTFAHPPTDKPQSALSRAEYGYHFEPKQWSSVFLSKINTNQTMIIEQNIVDLVQGQNGIEFLQLQDGTEISADLFIDCSGSDSQRLTSLGPDFILQRDVNLTHTEQATVKTGPACRLVKGSHTGWQLETPLRSKNHTFSLSESTHIGDHVKGRSFKLGHLQAAWQGNCVSIGHAAYALEPITAAPYILLKRDITRLLELIPVSQDTQIEQQEYNRLYYNDVTHAELFHHAIYAGQREVGFPKNEKLERKLTQYLHRGVLASFDFEPFNQQDWAILHAGLGRIPKRYDRMAEEVGFEEMETELLRTRKGISHLANSMPEHHIYLEKLTQYLRNNPNHGL